MILCVQLSHLVAARTCATNVPLTFDNTGIDVDIIRYDLQQKVEQEVIDTAVPSAVIFLLEDWTVSGLADARWQNDKITGVVHPD